MPTSAACSATASLTPSPRNATSTPVRRATLMMPRLLLGADPREDRRVRDGRGERVVVERARARAPVSTPSTSRPMSRQTLAATRAVVAGDDLDRDAERGELGDRRAGVGLRPVDEREEAGELEVALVGRRSGDRRPGAGAGGDGDDAGAVGEQPRRAPPARAVGHVDAAREDGLGRALRDQQLTPVGRVARRPTRAGARGRTAAARAARSAAAVGAASSGAASGAATARRRARCRRPARRRSSVASLQSSPSSSDVAARRAGRVERLVEGDRALGERAGLVGEQHLDVAEILDGHEPLDEHRLRASAREPRREADATRSPAGAAA